jgi:ADP-ribose pyrophosphatase YjhB (NUDIX family)
MVKFYDDDKEFYENLPKKRLGVGALVFYKKDLLIVQPTYNPAWLIPGGVVEAEESPLEALHRELFTDLNLDITVTELLAVDYLHNLDVRGECVQLLFATKPISELAAQNIRIPDMTLKDYQFASVDKALSLLVPHVARRVENALIARAKDQPALYLEDGRQWNMAKVP